MFRPARGVGDDAREPRQIAAAVLACFFFSGSTGLIYEVLWTRMLGLVFGHTVFAITTVLAAFMAGLGLGSYLFGRFADRHARPLFLYGVLEMGIGAYALLTPALFGGAEGIYIPLRQGLELSFFAFSLAQFVLIFGILLFPATLMGGTLPILSRFFVRDLARLGGQVGRLYAFNTFGAVLGTYLAGFHLIPVLGIRRSLLFAAVLNIGIGLLCLVFDRHLRQLGAARPAEGPESRGAEEPRSTGEVAGAPLPPGPSAPLRSGTGAMWLAVIGLGISGAASMMYEVAWTRALALVIGSSTYAFSTMLVTFLAGLALGSYLFSRLPGRLRVDPVLFGWLQLAIGLCALGVTPFFDRLPELFLGAFRISHAPGFMQLVRFGISALAMFLPTLFIGATFPCVAQIASSTLARVGHDVGRVYLVNTAGAIAGTLLAGFLLIPAWGLEATLRTAVTLNLGLALALFLTGGAPAWQRVGASAVAIGALLALHLAPAWDARAMASGVAIYGKSYLGFLNRAGFRQTVARLDEMLFYEDGIGATVSVHRERNLLYLRVNGKTDASTGTRDMRTQIMMAHLPLLFRPQAERVLVIGLGSGVTAGAVALHPVGQVDVIEIEPAVIRAAAFFTGENREVLSNPRVRVTIADGRNFLLAAETPYDVIISEPSNPWLRGIGSLFSREFYELAARRLRPDGIVCQWIHVYNLFPDDVRMVVKTFRSVFPRTSIWSGSSGDLLLVGSNVPLTLDAAVLQERYRTIAGLREDFTRLGLRSPLALLADFVLSEADAARYAEQAWLNTDDLPLLEFSAPESLYAETGDLNHNLLRAYRQQPLPPLQGVSEGELDSAAFHRDLGMAYLGKEMADQALEHFDAALARDPRDAVALLQRGRLRQRQGAVLRAEADYKAVLALDPRSFEAHDALASLYAGQRMPALAAAQLHRAHALRPDDGRTLLRLGDLSREQHRFPEAISHYRTAAALLPRDAAAWIGLGLAHRALDQHTEAVAAFRHALERDPENLSAQYHLGVSLLESRQLDEALSLLRSAAARDAARPDPLLALGRLYAARGQPELAADAFQQVLDLDPSNAAAIRALDGLSASAGGSRP